MTELKALYFDGKTSAAKTVLVRIFTDSVLILGELEQELTRDQLRITPPMKNCPLVIELPDGARLEIAPQDFQYEQIKSLLSSKSQFLNWLETNYLSLFTSVLLLIVGLLLVIQVVLPRFSGALALKVPQAWANSLDSTIIDSLEGKYFSPSELPQQRQGELLTYLHNNIENPPQILFRKLGLPNAFALAGNTMIISDELVKAMDQDEEVLAVSLHEVAHLKKRHVISMLISSSTLSVLAFFIIGDMVGMTEWVLNTGVFLVSAKYSRSYEQQADELALASLRKLNLSPACFKQALLNLESAYKLLKLDHPKLFDYLSSHPGTNERVSHIKDERCGE